MYMTGGYWSSWPEDERSGYRDHCYRLSPAGKGKVIMENDWLNVYKKLGEMGYRFRDAGHCADYMVISLNKPIAPKDMKRLTRFREIKDLKDAFFVVPDSGYELGFC